MNLMRFLMALAAAFVLISAFDFVFHGVYMKDAWYDTHAAFWRAPEDVPMQWMFIGQFLMALAIGLVLLFGGRRGMGPGALAGLCVAVAFTALYLVFYAVQPFPPGMVVNWVLGAFAEAVLAGSLFGAIYKS